ncbi:MAG TPA: FRG domain-containing protein [Verrucomicrobiae bacterium]|nr:FRG domain-containing protein [Verrucomicrobiae bacterium]
MPRKSFEHGILTHECKDWIELNEFITKRLDRSPTVWRGQRDAAWLLEPTLARVIRRLPHKKSAVGEHLSRFIYATRGRRGPSPRQIPEENAKEWWALGQHHGLATPLLDWTHSPYAAAFFAYSEAVVPKGGFRAVYGLVERPVSEKSDELYETWKETYDQFVARNDEDAIEKLGEPETVTFFRPLTDENQRLVNQNGLFTFSPLEADIEAWIKKHFSGESRFPKLYKLLLPDSERLTALKSLNRMNINYLSLYPDIAGACLHCNMALEIEHY